MSSIFVTPCLVILLLYLNSFRLSISSPHCGFEVPDFVAITIRIYKKIEMKTDDINSLKIDG